MEKKSWKKYSRKRKLNEKNSCTPINHKKYSCCGLKKIHTKISAARKFHFLLCPITFLMVRPLRLSWCRRRRETGLFGADIRPGLAWWRKREKLTLILIRFVAFSNHNFTDYLLEIVPVFFESHFKLDF